MAQLEKKKKKKVCLSRKHRDLSLTPRDHINHIKGHGDMVVHFYNHSPWAVVDRSLGFNGHPAYLLSSQPMRDPVFSLDQRTCLQKASELGLLAVTHLHRRELYIRPALEIAVTLLVISMQCCINCTWGVKKC